MWCTKDVLTRMLSYMPILRVRQQNGNRVISTSVYCGIVSRSREVQMSDASECWCHVGSLDFGHYLVEIQTLGYAMR